VARFCHRVGQNGNSSEAQRALAMAPKQQQVKVKPGCAVTWVNGNDRSRARGLAAQNPWSMEQWSR